jgi:hypothetical protein
LGEGGDSPQPYAKRGLSAEVYANMG